MTALASRLCPWLQSPLASLEAAHARGRLGHGWIIAGPKGTGKLNLALVFAERLLRGMTGTPPPSPIEPGELVRALDERHQPQDRHADLHVVWPEEGKRSIGIDAIRSVIEQINLTGYAGSLKAVVIEPAEAMTVQAANALLKSLEEPAAGTHLLLVSHLPGRLPATIRSRCQTLSVKRPPEAIVADWLGQSVGDPSQPLVGGPGIGPVDAARRIAREDINKYSKLDDIIKSLRERRITGGEAADACRSLDMGLVLEWIAGRLQHEIRARARLGVSNSITDGPAYLTENPWRSMTAGKLLAVVAETEKLRQQLDSGLNEELALEVLLNELIPA